MPGNVRKIALLQEPRVVAILEEYQKLLDQIAVRKDGKMPPHYDEPEAEITTPDASSLATSKTLAKALAVFVEAHATGATTGRHGAATTIAIAAWSSKPNEPADLAEAQAMANEIKADINTHIAVANAHRWTETAIATADGSDQGTTNTLLNAIKAFLNAHRAGVRDIQTVAS